MISLFLFVLSVLCLPDCVPDEPCSVSCNNDGSGACSGIINGTDSDSFVISCNGNRACKNILAEGLKSEPGETLVQCGGSYDCEGSSFDASEAVDAVFNCTGVYACKASSFVCGEGDCTLNCVDESTTCRDMATFECEGGDSACTINCHGGCYNALPWSCRTYPCTVTIDCLDPSPIFCPASPCPVGEQVCSDHVTCVNASTTCAQAMPTTTTVTTTTGSQGSSTSGGSGSGSTTPAATQPPETIGTALVIRTYASADCSGEPEAEETVELGCSAPDPGTFVYSSCSNLGWCQTSRGTGTCGGITLDCARTEPLDECTQLNGKNVRVSCAGVKSSASSLAAPSTLATMLLMSVAAVRK